MQRHATVKLSFISPRPCRKLGWCLPNSYLHLEGALGGFESAAVKKQLLRSSPKLWGIWGKDNRAGEPCCQLRSEGSAGTAGLGVLGCCLNEASLPQDLTLSLEKPFGGFLSKHPYSSPSICKQRAPQGGVGDAVPQLSSSRSVSILSI